MRPKLPEVRGGEPKWWSELKRWCRDTIIYIDKNKVYGDGRSVVIHDQIISTVDDPIADELMHQVIRTGETTIDVRHGVAVRWAKNTQTQVDTTIGAVTDGDPGTRTEIASLTTTQWIVGTLDNAYAPTTFTIAASGSASYPVDNDKKVVAIALVTCTDSIITDIYQAHLGPWFSYWMKPSATNLDYDAQAGTYKDHLQDRLWSTASGEGSGVLATNVDLFMFQDVDDSLLKKYITAFDLVQDTLDDGVDGTGIELGSNTTYDHGNLLGLDDDDHAGPVYPYMLLGAGDNPGAQTARNSLAAEDNYIGNRLFVETALGTDLIQDYDGNARIDVDNSTLSGSWTTVTEHDSAKFSITGTGDYWDAADLTAAPTGDVTFQPGVDFNVVAAGDVNMQTGDDMVLLIGDALTVNGQTGQNIANWLTNGWITGAGVQEYAARVLPAGGGTPIDVNILIRV